MAFLQNITPFVIVGGFLLFLLVYALYSTYAIHHLNEFGYSGDASQKMLRLYVGFSAVIIILTIVVVAIGIMTL